MQLPITQGRSPHGERGLKHTAIVPLVNGLASLPPRGAWIETYDSDGSYGAVASRSPHGERGLKLSSHITKKFNPRRSPHGERGLKYLLTQRLGNTAKSLPPRGAWIETRI